MASIRYMAYRCINTWCVRPNQSALCTVRDDLCAQVMGHHEVYWAKGFTASGTDKAVFGLNRDLQGIVTETEATRLYGKGPYRQKRTVKPSKTDESDMLAPHTPPSDSSARSSAVVTPDAPKVKDDTVQKLVQDEVTKQVSGMKQELKQQLAQHLAEQLAEQLAQQLKQHKTDLEAAVAMMAMNKS